MHFPYPVTLILTQADDPLHILTARLTFITHKLQNTINFPYPAEILVPYHDLDYERSMKILRIEFKHPMSSRKWRMFVAASAILQRATSSRSDVDGADDGLARHVNSLPNVFHWTSEWLTLCISFRSRHADTPIHRHLLPIPEHTFAVLKAKRLALERQGEGSRKLYTGSSWWRGWMMTMHLDFLMIGR
jgi:hypothetical protein